MSCLVKLLLVFYATGVAILILAKTKGNALHHPRGLVTDALACGGEGGGCGASFGLRLLTSPDFPLVLPGSLDSTTC